MSIANAPARAIVRLVLIIVAVALTLYLLYLLRQPIGWLIVAGFIAIAMAGPVRFLHRYMPRGLAIFLAYLGLLLIPVLLGAILLPPIVTQLDNLAANAPEYVADVREFIDENGTLRNLDQKYDIGAKLQEEAAKLPARIGDAAGVLGDIGVGIVNSVFALVTILILSVFMVSGGPGFRNRMLELQPSDRRARLERVLERVGDAVASYVGGALVQATIAGVLAYLVLLVLGVEFRAPLAVLVFVFDLIPLVGATIGAVLVGLVTLFFNFPTATIAWVVWSIVYQQIENNVIQPQIQKRAVDVHPFVVLTAVLFGATLFGVVGALLAIPVAASVQIAVREWLDWRKAAEAGEAPPPPEPGSPTPTPAAPPGAGPPPQPAAGSGG
jgi:predicted PurR-regulated permease PerM